MTYLYAVAGSLSYFVANTSNLSEGMVGYTTKWGDNTGDFSPIANYTKSEVCEIGLLLGLPEELVNKAPNDGLSGKSDEEKLGITYKNLDSLIRNGEINEDYKEIIKLNKLTRHKRDGVVVYKNNLPNHMEK
jgi:NAD+ synthase